MLGGADAQTFLEAGWQVANGDGGVHALCLAAGTNPTQSLNALESMHPVRKVRLADLSCHPSRTIWDRMGGPTKTSGVGASRIHRKAPRIKPS